MAQKDATPVTRTLCQHSQLKETVPVDIYNPSDESIQLYSKTTLGILTPIEWLTVVQ